MTLCVKRLKARAAKVQGGWKGSVQWGVRDGCIHGQRIRIQKRTWVEKQQLGKNQKTNVSF